MTPTSVRTWGFLALALGIAIPTALWVQARRRSGELEAAVEEQRSEADRAHAALALERRAREGLEAELASVARRLARLEPMAPHLATETFRGEREGFIGTRYKLRLAQVSPTPDPERSPYADCLVVLEATVLEAGPRAPGEPADVSVADGERVLVTAWGFQAREPALAAALRPGDVVWCTLLDPGAVDASVSEIQVVDTTGEYELPSYLGCALVRESTSSVRLDVVEDPRIRDGMSRQETITAVGERVLEELRLHGGGSWDAWSESLAPFRAVVERLRANAEVSEELKACDGLRLRAESGPWFEGYSSALLRGPSTSPSAVELVAGVSRQLQERGIDLVYVPVNLKSAVEPERMLFAHREVIPESGIVDPQWRRYVAELCEAGVEVIDLLPFLLAEKRAGDQPLYLFDHHWAPRTLEIAADLVAQRLRRHGFTRAAEGERYRLVRGELEASGEAVAAHAVFEGSDGKSYEDEPSSPVLVLGDSNLFVGSGALDGIRSSVSGGNASFTAQLAYRLGFPVALGGRFLVEEGARMARARDGFFRGRKVVVLVSGMTRSCQDGPLPAEPIVLPARLFE